MMQREKQGKVVKSCRINIGIHKKMADISKNHMEGSMKNIGMYNI